MLPILQIGPFAVQTFGLVILLSLWAGIWLSEKYANKFKISSEVLDKIILYSLLSTVLAARLFYFFRFPSAFFKSPLNLVALNVQMMDWQGGVLAGILVFLILVQQKKLNIWPVLDALSPMLLVAGIGAGLATLAVGSQYGVPTNLPWGINLWGEIRHPVQIYQAVGFACILYLLIRKLKKLEPETENSQNGKFFLWTLIYATTCLILTDTFRQDTPIIFGQFHVLQIASFILLLLGIFQFNHLVMLGNSREGQVESDVIDES